MSLRKFDDPAVLLVFDLNPSPVSRFRRALIDFVLLPNPKHVPRIRLDQSNQIIVPGTGSENEINLKIHVIPQLIKIQGHAGEGTVCLQPVESSSKYLYHAS